MLNPIQFSKTPLKNAFTIEDTTLQNDKADAQKIHSVINKSNLELPDNVTLTYFSDWHSTLNWKVHSLNAKFPGNKSISYPIKQKGLLFKKPAETLETYIKRVVSEVWEDFNLLGLKD